LNSSLKNKALFSCANPYIFPLLNAYEYPWEILPHIQEYVLHLIRQESDRLQEIAPNVYAYGPVKIAPSAVLEGPILLGEGCEIRPGAYLRGRVLLGEGCVIGNSTELKNCVLMDGVQVPHYNYVGDSILGTQAHLGAGAVCSNLKHDKTNVVIRGATPIPTEQRKVGAFLGDGVDVGCGCVLNPGTVIGKNSAVYPLIPLRGVYPENCIIKEKDLFVVREK